VNPPILTIIVPTYNRSRCLEVLLRTLHQEVASLKDEVTVMVLDNCSDDDTHNVINRMGAEWPALQSHRHEQNIGAENNFLYGVKLVESRWFWILSDDDLPKLGLIGQLIGLLRFHKPTLLHLRSHWIKKDAELEINGLNKLPAQKNKLLVFDLDALSFAKYTNSMVSFISGMIIDRDGLNVALNGHRIDRFNYSNLIQLGWVLPMLSKPGRFLYVADKCILTRIETRGYDSMSTLGISYAQVVNQVYGSDSPIARTFIKINLVHFLPNLIWKSRLCSSTLTITRETWNHLKEYYGTHFFYKTVILLIGTSPYFISYLLLQICRVNSLLHRNLRTISLAINRFIR
jgi:glycosyltransferase involved in cell wall biosynthesis